MKAKKYTISVRNYGGKSIYEGQFSEIEKVNRRVYCDAVGNFNRLACRYKGKTYLVNSDDGDPGDPFRGTDKNLFINTDCPCQWNL